MSVFLITKGRYIGLKIDLHNWKKIIPVDFERKLTNNDVFSFFIENRGADMFAKVRIKYDTATETGKIYYRNFTGSTLLLLGNEIKAVIEDLNFCINCKNLTNQNNQCNSCEVEADWVFP